MGKDQVARATVEVEAPADEVWAALVTPETIEKYMFGSKVVSDWKEGSPITWKGEWKGKAYEDKGEIVRIEPGRVLEYTHYSPLSGEPDAPESYHRVKIELAELGGQTRVSLSQDNNPTAEAREHSEKNWATMLDGLKKVVEH